MSTWQYWMEILNHVILLLTLCVLYKKLGNFESNLSKKLDNIERILGRVKNKVGSIENKAGSINTTVGRVAEGVTDLREQLSYHERQCAARHEEFIRQLRAIAASRASEAPPAAPQQD